MTTSSEEKNLAIGIDIGGTTTTFGIVDRRGRIYFRGVVSTNKYDNPEDFSRQTYEALIPLVEEAGGLENIKGVGIGAPNGNYNKGTIEYAANLKWKGVVPIADMFKKLFKRPVALTNDANAAAAGEMMYGAVRGVKDFIMITLGTGVGSGIVANGQIILGHDGFAGELGHVVVCPGGRYHEGTGHYGSLETYASATGVKKTALEFLETYKKEESPLRKVKEADLTSRAIYECAQKGDRVSKEIFEFTGEILGRALANFVMFSSPECIVFFGGLAKAGKYILAPTKRHMENNLLQIFKNKVKLISSELSESDAAILGASALVWETH